MVFHAGELEIQKRVGVRDIADDVGGGIMETIPDSIAEFLKRRPFAIIGTVDSGHRAWASVVTGEPGFIKVPEPRTLKLESLPPPGDPLLANLAAESHAALIAIDLLKARRVRINGKALVDDGAIWMTTEQVYANCPRYIQERMVVSAEPQTRSAKVEIRRSSSLSPSQREQIAAADTFFIASEHPDSGADVSHKGGNPGFVRVIDERHLGIPDYNGNRMFNTLGNLLVNPKAGLLFIDFKSGRTLQISGSASVDFDSKRARDFAGAERVLDFQIDEIIDNSAGFPLTAKFRQFSRYNPRP
ncbi:MAG TPA: pyridoxamine 5'-phosphate oxidase family protein [Candidatus Binataceae bacterium]|nr:pyridoxamine 5'-phosphate oxidase family protein [Candidatus Binataceae bacterium]